MTRTIIILKHHIHVFYVLEPHVTLHLCFFLAFNFVSTPYVDTLYTMQG